MYLLLGIIEQKWEANDRKRLVSIAGERASVTVLQDHSIVLAQVRVYFAVIAHDTFETSYILQIV